MTAQMARCFALRHEERVGLNCQMHYYFSESQATLILLHQEPGKGKVRKNFSHFLSYGFINFSLKAVVKQSQTGGAIGALLPPALPVAVLTERSLGKLH